MRKLLVVLIASLHCYSGEVFQVGASLSPNASGIVSQQLVKNTYSYKTENGFINKWYFCGQASASTVINQLRQSQNPDKYAQLEYFHSRLKARQPGYSSDVENPHKEASMDYLLPIFQYDKGTEFSANKESGYGTSGRNFIKQKMHSLLGRGDTYIIALSRKKINGTWFGHFFVIYKIDYNPSGLGGGTVYYLDPYLGTFGSSGYTSFLNEMSNAGTPGRYSILWVRKK